MLRIRTYGRTMSRDFRGFPSPRRENAPINLSYAVERLRRHAGYITALSSVRNFLEVIVVLKCCQRRTFRESTGLVPVGLIFSNSPSQVNSSTLPDPLSIGLLGIP